MYLKLVLPLSARVYAVDVRYSDFVADGDVAQRTQLQAAAQERLHGTRLAAAKGRDNACVACECLCA